MDSTSINDGSSPRMRGTDSPGGLCRHGARFIPAHAGNGPRAGLPSCRLAVHPRACGERVRTRDCNCWRGGSSPRMRGTGHHFTLCAIRFRFIPAHAGNGALVLLTLRRSSVHPRACGERRVGRKKAERNVGSSPRMRGTGKKVLLGRHETRFIPAHAGNGKPIIVWLENMSGSSPRMRGTDTQSRWSMKAGRFIPAHAGNGLIITAYF